MATLKRPRHSDSHSSDRTPRKNPRRTPPSPLLLSVSTFTPALEKIPLARRSGIEVIDVDVAAASSAASSSPSSPSSPSSLSSSPFSSSSSSSNDATEKDEGNASEDQDQDTDNISSDASSPSSPSPSSSPSSSTSDKDNTLNTASAPPQTLLNKTTHNPPWSHQPQHHAQPNTSTPLLTRLATLLPKLAAANSTLSSSLLHANGGDIGFEILDAETREDDDEDVDSSKLHERTEGEELDTPDPASGAEDEGHKGAYIEMTLGLGVLEELKRPRLPRSSSSSSSLSSESPHQSTASEACEVEVDKGAPAESEEGGDVAELENGKNGVRPCRIESAADRDTNFTATKRRARKRGKEREGEEEDVLGVLMGGGRQSARGRIVEMPEVERGLEADRR